MKKICSKCGQEKNLSEFNKDKYSKDNHKSSCKSCKKIYDDKYYENNKKNINKKCNIYKKNNKDKILEYKKEYYKNNKIKYKKWHQKYLSFHKTERNKYLKEKRNNDINYKIKCNLRTRISKALKENWKSGNTIELLGCSIDELKIHLENQFQEGMNWDNYGEWHIDHKIPCSIFNLTDKFQQEICFKYTNLQPLWAKDNISKNSKLY